MKAKVLIFAVIMFAAGACTQRTCSTYAKDSVKKLPQQSEERV